MIMIIFAVCMRAYVMHADICEHLSSFSTKTTHDVALGMLDEGNEKLCRILEKDD